MLNVISRRSNGVPPLELPGPVLELGGVAADPRRRRVGLDELYVHSDGQRAVLHAKGMEEPLLLHNGEHDTALHTAFALPQDPAATARRPCPGAAADLGQRGRLAASVAAGKGLVRGARAGRGRS
ncbi:hypothetical protein GCM10020220_111720 [Nonomuraea rubra]